MSYLAIYKGHKNYTREKKPRYALHNLDEERVKYFEERDDVFIFELPEDAENLESLINTLQPLKYLLKNKIESVFQG